MRFQMCGKEGAFGATEWQLPLPAGLAPAEEQLEATNR
jgi:hypothetical protein